MSFSFDNEGPSFATVFKRKTDVLARAAMSALNQAAGYIKQAGASDIAAAGFSTRWQKAISTRVYPETGAALDAALVARHKIPYANVFEEGAQIAGQPLLWLPLPSAKEYVSIGDKPTPQRVRARGFKLISINRPGREPLLAVKLARATLGDKIVPVFFGIPLVNIPRKFHFRAVSEQAQEKLPGWFKSAIKDS